MNSTATMATNQDGIEADFRRVMASVIEQACASGREMEVMEALFPVLLNNVGEHDGEAGEEPGEE